MGCYDDHNTGDDAFVSAFIWGASEYWKCERIHVCSTYLHDIPANKYAVPVYPRKTLFPKHRGLCQIFAGMKCKMALWAGGSLFNNGTDFNKLHTITKLFRMQNIKMAAIGVSIGPFASIQQQEECRRFLTNLAFLGLRDKISLERVKEMTEPCPYELTFDLAPILLDIESSQSAGAEITQTSLPESNTLGVAICNFQEHTGGMKGNINNTIDRLASTLLDLNNTRALSVKIFEFRPDNDGKVMNDKLKSKLNDFVPVQQILYTNNPIDMLEEIRSCDIILAMPLHSAIFSYIAERPFLVFNYHEKCEAFANYIGKQHEDIFNPHDFDTYLLKEQIINKLDIPERSNIMALSEAKAKARRNFDVLQEHFV